MYSDKFVAISLCFFGLCFKGWPLRLGVSCLINCNLHFRLCGEGIFHFREAWLKLPCSCRFLFRTWDVTVVCVCWYVSAWTKVEKLNIKRCLGIGGGSTAAVLYHLQQALCKGLLCNGTGFYLGHKDTAWVSELCVHHCTAGLLLPSPAAPPPPPSYSTAVP